MTTPKTKFAQLVLVAHAKLDLTTESYKRTKHPFKLKQYRARWKNESDGQSRRVRKLIQFREESLEDTVKNAHAYWSFVQTELENGLQ